MSTESQPAQNHAVCPVTGEVCPNRAWRAKRLTQVEQTLEYIRVAPYFEYNDGLNTGDEYSSLMFERRIIMAFLSAEGDCQPQAIECAVGHRALELARQPQKIFELIDQ